MSFWELKSPLFHEKPNRKQAEMEHLKLFETAFKLLKIYGFEFEYEKNWKGMLKHCFYLQFIITAIFLMAINIYFMLYKATSLPEITDGLSKFTAVLFPVFRSITYYLQRKTAIKIFELMKEISVDCKLINILRTLNV
jgi:hypothetical protein